MRILNVDDNAENRYLIEALGHANGFEVLSARNGVEALETLEGQLVDLIVSDVLMPGMDGFQFCHEVKSHERTRRIPFIFYTATYTAAQDAELGLSLGASRYVLKPVEPDEFMAILAEVIRQAQKGELAVPEGEQKETADYLKAYTARLVHKLDGKIEQLDAARNELQALLAARDSEIAQRKRAEGALAASESRLRALLESASQGIVAVSEDGCIVLVNAKTEEMFGYARDELLGQPLDTLLPERYRTAHAEHLRHYFAHPYTRVMVLGPDLRGRAKNGNEFPLEVTLSCTELNGSQLAMALITNITQRKNLEEQFRQAQKLESVGRLAGGIAHDFNNLLTVILGFSDFVLSNTDHTTTNHEYLEEIKNAAERAAALTRQLLAFSRKQVLQPRVLDLNTVVSDIEKMLRRLLGADVELTTVLSRDVAPIRADATQVEQIIMNLAVNASDAMPEGGKLTIETGNTELGEEYCREHVDVQPGRYVMLAVSDTGQGMSAETKAHVFEPFFTTKESGKGTGLGLSTVFGIVKQSGGSIWVYSEVGRGTTFKIYLPCVEAAVAEAPRAEAPGAHGSETVLLVEDDESVRMLVRAVLSERGYSVFEASNASEAFLFRRRHTGPIHLLLTDLVLPQVSGIELSAKLLALAPGLKVLFMSGYTDRTVALGSHDRAFIQKPFTPEALSSKVREVLDAQQAGRAGSRG